MGIFSGIVKLDKALGLRTGATKAAREAKERGEQQYDLQEGFLDEMGGYYQPAIQQGQQAGSMLSGFYTGNQQPILDAVKSSPFLAQNIAMGENAIARNRQATGGFRSGTTQQNLAENSQINYQNAVNQYLSGLGTQQQFGANALNNYASSGANMLNQLGGTSSAIANVGINQAANKQNNIAGLASLAGNAASSFFGGS